MQPSESSEYNLAQTQPVDRGKQKLDKATEIRTEKIEIEIQIDPMKCIWIVNKWEINEKQMISH